MRLDRSKWLLPLVVLTTCTLVQCEGVEQNKDGHKILVKRNAHRHRGRFIRVSVIEDIWKVKYITFLQSREIYNTILHWTQQIVFLIHAISPLYLYVYPCLGDIWHTWSSACWLYDVMLMLKQNYPTTFQPFPI